MPPRVPAPALTTACSAQGDPVPAAETGEGINSEREEPAAEHKLHSLASTLLPLGEHSVLGSSLSLPACTSNARGKTGKLQRLAGLFTSCFYSVIFKSCLYLGFGAGLESSVSGLWVSQHEKQRKLLVVPFVSKSISL